MEDIEVPTEHLHEAINEKAEGSKEKWFTYSAVSTALMAVFAALASLFAGHHSNEALIEQIKASDQWSYYQAKGIKYEIAQGIVLQHAALSAEPPAEIKQKQTQYKADQEAIKEKAHECEELSEQHLKKHVTLAASVTMFQIAIAISAIAMLTRKSSLWYVSLVLATGGIISFFMGIL